MENTNETKVQDENTENKLPENAENQAETEKKAGGNNLALAFVMTAAVSMALGAGGLYLSKRKQIEFADRYSLMLETEDYMVNSAEIGRPKNPTDAQIINAYLSLYGDEYTFYEEVDIKSKEFILALVNQSDAANGTGFQIDFNEEDKLYFSNIIEDMPADEQGIVKGDIILSVDGKEISEYEDAKLLKSSKEKTVELLINRNGEEINVDFNIYPVLNTDTATVSYEKYDNVLYIDYNAVQIDNQSIFMKALSENTYDSIIIDVRNNPGGNTDCAMQTADMFVDKAELCYHSYTEGDYTIETTDGKLTEVPIVILANENTASGAEVFMSLLKQYADTTIVGTKTFGKGIYQSFGMFNGNSLHYTDGYFTVGEWECWQGKGIAPDIEVEMDVDLIGTDDDVQLEKAIELLS